MKWVVWSMVTVGAVAAVTPGMTFIGFLWLVLLVPVVLLMIRLCTWMVVEDVRETQRTKRFDPAGAQQNVAVIPRGWDMEDYVKDGLRCLRIHLIQSARRASP